MSEQERGRTYHENEYHQPGPLGGEVRKRTDYYLYQKHETSTASQGTVTDRRCPDCRALMLYFGYCDSDICPECGVWLTSQIPEFITEAADALDESVDKFVEEVNTDD